MLEKIKRQKNLGKQDRQMPSNTQELINFYNLNNEKIYDFLDYIVDYLNERGIWNGFRIYKRRYAILKIST